MRGRAVKRFVRENLMIVVSVALPVAVVLLFALATAIPRWLVEPPRYDALIASAAPTYGGELPVRLEFDVMNGRLRLRAFELPDGARASAPRLFEYVAAQRAVREITFRLPDELEALADGAPIDLPLLADRRIDRALEAPDGYVFEQRAAGGGGLFTELFGVGRGRYAARLRKNGAAVPVRLPVDAPNYYYGLRFLGWVVE